LSYAPRFARTILLAPGARDREKAVTYTEIVRSELRLQGRRARPDFGSSDELAPQAQRPAQ